MSVSTQTSMPMAAPTKARSNSNEVATSDKTAALSDAAQKEDRMPSGRATASVATGRSHTADRDGQEPGRAASLLAAAGQRGLLGVKDRQMGGRFPSALVEAAQKASGIHEPTELLTYALAKVAFEDNYGEKLLELEGTVPRGTFTGTFLED